MIRAYIIGESMRPETSLADLHASLVKVARDIVTNAAANEPKLWTTVTFETDLEPRQLAEKFSEVLDDDPGSWYTNFRAGEEVFVIFPHRVFQYRAGDKAERRRVQEYALSVGVSRAQVDWDEE